MTIDVDVALLKEKLDHLEEVEKTNECKLRDLENELDEIQAKIRLGKGVLIGVVFTLGSIGLAVFDRVREVLIKYL